MAKYTVKNTETGQRVTFEWNGSEPPTDSDMEEVFSAAASFKQPEQQKKKEVKIETKNENALFPRLSKVEETGKGNKPVSAVLDVASIIPRGAVTGVGQLAEILGGSSVKGTKESLGKISSKQIDEKGNIKLTPEQFKAATAPMTKETFKAAMARTGGENISGIEGVAEDIARDPANILSLIPVIGAARVASLAPKISKGVKVTQAIATPSTSIASHQGERASKGEEFNKPEIALEAAFSTLPLVSKAANKISIESMKSIINPSKKLKSQAAQDLISKAMDYSSVPGGLKGMKENILKKFEELGSANNKIISDADKSGEFVDIDKVFTEVTNDLKNNKKLTPIKDQINSAIEKASNNVASDFPSGMLLPSEALTYKRAVGQLGAWTKAVDEKGTLSTVMDPEATAREIVHNEIYKKVNEELSKIAGTGFKKINQQFSELIPVEKALTDAIERKPNLFGLGDLIGGGLTIAGGTQSLVSGLKTKEQGDETLSGALAPLALWAGYKGVRSPRTMSALYKTSKLATSKPASTFMQPLRSLISSYSNRNENQDSNQEIEAMKRRIQQGEK